MALRAPSRESVNERLRWAGLDAPRCRRGGACHLVQETLQRFEVEVLLLFELPVDEVHEVAADVELVHDSDAGSDIFPERFLISGLISGAATG